MRAVVAVVVVVVVVGAFAAAPALPCSIRLPGAVDAVWTVENREVPRNAELRIDGAIDDGSAVVLVDPDGGRETLSFVADPVGGRYLSTDELRPGANRLDIFRSGVEEGAPDRVVTFSVVDEDDVDAPAAPTVTAQVTTTGELFPIDCGLSAQWPRDVVRVDVDAGDDDAALFSVDGGPYIALADGGGTFANFEDRGGNVSYDVVVRDLAGNESEATTATAWSGCAGGCASSSSLPMTAALLLLLRRRTVRRSVVR